MPAQAPISLRELIAYRPLVYAWAWEIVCVLAAVYLLLTGGADLAVIGLIFVGVAPFGLAMLMFLKARKAGTLPKVGGIVE